MTKDLLVITPDQFRLSTCGAPLPPDSRALDLATWYVFTAVMQSLQTLTDLKQAISSEGDFYLRAIENRANSTNELALLVRFGFPDGTFLSNARERAGNTIGFASDRRSIEPQRYIPGGSKITIEIENPVAAVIPVTLVFSGVTRLYIA